LASIFLENRVGIELEQIDALMEEANLPDGKIVLVFNDAALPNELQGGCTPKILLQFCPSYRLICGRNAPRNWDVCIAFSKKACLRYTQFPAYFAYLLGHELGHARLCLIDPALHIHYCLIQEHICAASKGQISQWHELPHEYRLDQFGIYLSERLWPRTRLNREMETLMAQPDCPDGERLKVMLSLAPRADLDNIRAEWVEFSRPYKRDLIASWKKDRRKRGDNSLASLIGNYEELFE
jgi:hypothetical protein